MFHFFKNIKDKPLAYKRKVAIVMSGSIAGIIFVFFLALLFANVNEYQKDREEAAKNLDKMAKEAKAGGEGGDDGQGDGDKGSIGKMTDAFNTFNSEFENSPLSQQMKRNQASYATNTATTTATSTPTSDSGASESVIPYSTPSLSASSTTNRR